MLLLNLFTQLLEFITAIDLLQYIFGVLFVICLLGIVTHKL